MDKLEARVAGYNEIFEVVPETVNRIRVAAAERGRQENNGSWSTHPFYSKVRRELLKLQVAINTVIADQNLTYPERVEGIKEALDAFFGATWADENREVKERRQAKLEREIEQAEKDLEEAQLALSQADRNFSNRLIASRTLSLSLFGFLTLTV